MAKNVKNSHFSFARIFILAESMQLKNSPLLESVKRCRKPASDIKQKENINKIKPFVN